MPEGQFIKPELMLEKMREEIGLSEYEAKVYLTLITARALEPRKISVVTGIPESIVHAALGKLTDMGLVIEIKREPARYVPKPPAQVFEDYFKEYEGEARRLFSLISSFRVCFSPSAMKVRLSRAGNDTQMTVPESVLEALDWKEGDILEAHVADNSMIVRKRGRS